MSATLGWQPESFALIARHGDPVEIETETAVGSGDPVLEDRLAALEKAMIALIGMEARLQSLERAVASINPLDLLDADEIAGPPDSVNARVKDMQKRLAATGKTPQPDANRHPKRQ